MSAFDTVKKETESLPEDIKSSYGTPEAEVVEAKPVKCDHYFIRKSPTVFGCRSCTVHWIDNGEFQFTDGKFIDFLKRPHFTA